MAIWAQARNSRGPNNQFLQTHLPPEEGVGACRNGKCPGTKTHGVCGTCSPTTNVGRIRAPATFSTQLHCRHSAPRSPHLPPRFVSQFPSSVRAGSPPSLGLQGKPWGRRSDHCTSACHGHWPGGCEIIRPVPHSAILTTQIRPNRPTQECLPCRHIVKHPH